MKRIILQELQLQSKVQNVEVSLYVKGFGAAAVHD
jgi:hypothetical protein